MPKKKKIGGKKKNKSDGPSRSEAKRRQKVVEDKTFGLKNKNRSKKVQAKIRSMQNSASGNSRLRQQEEQMKKAEREAARRQREEERKFQFLERQAQAVKEKKAKKLAAQTKKKKICPFFMKGRCPRGDRCTLSHDWGDTRKVEKIDIYSDPREGTEFEPTNTTITCRHFMDALEHSKYGPRWVCPNEGKQCQYWHRLPEGVVFMTAEERKLAEEEKIDEDIPLEVILEREREDLILEGRNVTPVTEETFAEWKERKRQKKLEEMEEERLKASKKGKGIQILSGRALFHFDPSIFVDDDAAADADDVALGQQAEDVIDLDNVEESLFLEDFSDVE